MSHFENLTKMGIGGNLIQREIEFVNGHLKGIKIKEFRTTDFPLNKIITPCVGSSKYIVREIV